jgi:hypothetical protein
VWIGPLLLLVGSSFMGTWGTVPAVIGLGLPGMFFICIAFWAAISAKTDRASDIVLDDSGFVIEGGPLDKTHCKWSEVRGCEIVDVAARWAVRWIVLSWLTARRFASINRRRGVPVKQLVLSRKGDKLVLAEAEGDEIESLEQLRDSIRSAVTPPKQPAPLPQEILTCPHCDAPLVPAPTPRMTCTYCHRDLDVPAELQERVRASIELDQTSGSRESTVRKLVDQPSARRAAWVITWCRRLMVWIQPAAFVLWCVMIHHSTHDVSLPAGISVTRIAPDDDAIFLYDFGLFILVVAAGFAIAWSIGHAYIANRQALRMLADHFGAVPPAKPGAPSTCHNCNAPLPATTALLVHCAYCATENVLGLDPRPAAMRRKRESIDLARGLRRRSRARVRRWITIPVSVLLALVMIREVRIAWNVPDYDASSSNYFDGPWYCYQCGTVANDDGIRRTLTIAAEGKRVQTTLLAHGKVLWNCAYGCTIELDDIRVTPKDRIENDLRIEHGVLKLAAP